MGEITIRLNDATLLKALEQMASVHGRPIEDEVVAVLEHAVGGYRETTGLVERSRQIRAMSPALRHVNSVEIIHTMREERDRALGG
jgi:plasmid stability protein